MRSNESALLDVEREWIAEMMPEHVPSECDDETILQESDSDDAEDDDVGEDINSTEDD